MSGNDTDFSKLPPDLPVPVDDGAADHLRGMPVPSLVLPASDGSTVNLGELPGSVVLYAFPMMGRPGEALPEGWNETPGARGCTVQSLAYGKNLGDLAAIGLTVLGISVQPVEQLREAAGRLGLDQLLLSDSAGEARATLRLPTFEVEGRTYLRRLTLIVTDGAIAEVLYPVFPPGSDVEAVRSWAGR